jgi:hypothetical protein
MYAVRSGRIDIAELLLTTTASTHNTPIVDYRSMRVYSSAFVVYSRAILTAAKNYDCAVVCCGGKGLMGAAKFVGRGWGGAVVQACNGMWEDTDRYCEREGV